MTATQPDRILLVTGMSGAGKSTALKTLEDIGWETVDNLPFVLLDRLLRTEPAEGAEGRRALAIGIDSRTRGFAAQSIIDRIKTMNSKAGLRIATLFLDCSGTELERRFSETRRRHPLAPDRPASEGIARERELVAPLRRWADHLVDTSASSVNDLKQLLRGRFAQESGSDLALAIMSFGFARGVPRNADLVFDMRYLRNPHWEAALRPLTGRDPAVAAYVAADPSHDETVAQIEALLLTLLPRYSAEGKAYLTVAFGCTGGRHRSVHVAEKVGQRLRDEGFSPTIIHRDLASPADEFFEAGAGPGQDNKTGLQASH